MASEIEIRTCAERMPLCGCGHAEKMTTIIRDALRRAVALRALRVGDAPGFYAPMPDHDLSGVAMEYVAQTLTDAGYLEHGTSVGYGWLTRAGRILLDFLEEHGCDDGRWPEYAESPQGDEEFELDDKAWHELTLKSG